MRGVNIMLNQLWVGKTGRFWQHLFCVLVTCLLINGLAWGADEANKLIAVSMDSGAATPTVLIETAEPVGYRYTVYDSFEPTRVVIDFPGMVVADVAEAIAGDQGVVKEVKVATFALASGQLSRVEILLAENTEYQVNLDGNKFRVAFAADAKEVKSPAPVAMVEKAEPAAVATSSQDANVLRSVQISAGSAVLEINGKIGKFQHFALGNPPRLVVDLYGVHPGFKERSFPAEDGFKTVRVGTYNDKTRLVFDASANVLPEHTVEGRETDVLVSWGAAPEASAVSKAAVAPDPVAEPAPTVVAAPAPVVASPPVAAKTAPIKLTSANVEAIDFNNEEGRSVIAVALSADAQVTGPVEEGTLVRFEIVNATISRALRRTIDASAFPSAVTSVTPYTVKDGDHQNVRIAVDLKGPVAYALEKDGASVRLVIDDGAYAEPIPAAVSQVEVVAPERAQMESATAPQKMMARVNDITCDSR